MCDENLKRSAEESQLEDGDATKPVKVARIEENSSNHVDLTEKISSLEEKLSNYELANKELKVALTADKIVRLLSDSTEKQSKMTKELASLTKMIEKQEE